MKSLSYFLPVFAFLSGAWGQQNSAYPTAPSSGWVYTFDGSKATPDEAAALDGTWNHGNGSDAWDESGIGDGAPGGVSSFTEGGVAFLRMQDPGDPRGFKDIADPSNRKMAFFRDMGADGANAGPTAFKADYKPLRDGVTLNFRMRLATTGKLDKKVAGGAEEDFPKEGDGYTLHDGGKSTIGIHEMDTDNPEEDRSGKISFSLALPTDEQEGAPDESGLIMNSKNGDAVSADVEAGQGDQNLFPVKDPTNWHEFWVTIIKDAGGGGTHRVEIYADGGATAKVFHVTAGNGQDANADYLWMEQGSTPQSGAVDIDFYRVAQGAHKPGGGAVVPDDPVMSVAGTADVGSIASPGKAELTVTVKNTGATKPLAISAADIQPPAAEWKVLSKPMSVAPGGTGEIKLAFDSGGKTGPFTASLVIQSNDAKNPKATVNLKASVTPPPSTGDPAALKSKLVAWWPLDEKTGTKAANALGAKHTGDVVGTAEWQPAAGKFGGCVFFDGSDGAIEVPDHADFEFAIGEPFSVSLWYKRDGIEDDQGLVTKGYSTPTRAPTGYWQLQTRAGTFTLDSREGAGGDPRLRLDSSSGIKHGDGAWHHFVVVRDGAAGQVRLYVDGKVTVHNVTATKLGNWAMGVNDEPLVIANHFSRFTQGWFDDVAIWKGYALADSEVALVSQGMSGVASQSTGGEVIKPTAGRVRFGADGLLLEFFGARDVAVEYSETLLPGSWQVIAPNVTLLNGQGVFQETNAGRRAKPKGFYRAVNK